MPPFSIKTPALALRFRNPGTTSLSFWPSRQSTIEAAARFSELNPQQAASTRSGFGTLRSRLM
jgi:hypothetical protein